MQAFVSHLIGRFYLRHCASFGWEAWSDVFPFVNCSAATQIDCVRLLEREVYLWIVDCSLQFRVDASQVLGAKTLPMPSPALVAAARKTRPCQLEKETQQKQQKKEEQERQKKEEQEKQKKEEQDKQNKEEQERQKKEEQERQQKEEAKTQDLHGQKTHDDKIANFEELLISQKTDENISIANKKKKKKGKNAKKMLQTNVSASVSAPVTSGPIVSPSTAPTLVKEQSTATIVTSLTDKKAENIAMQQKVERNGAKEDISLENNNRGPRFAKKPQRRIVAPLVAEAMEKNWRDFRLTPFRGQWFRDEPLKKREVGKQDNNKHRKHENSKESSKTSEKKQN